MATEDSMTDQPRTTAQILGAFRRELIAQDFGPDEVTHLVYRATDFLDGICVAAEVPAVEVTPPVAVGDVLTTQEDYDRAPREAVAMDAWRGPKGVYRKRRNGLWSCTVLSCSIEHVSDDLAGVARTVLYVPTEVSA